MTRRTALAAAFGALALPAQDNPVIRVEVDRVNVLFSVRDKAGAFVNSLTQADIEVREDGKLQEIRTFTRESDLPLTIGLLVDVSRSQERLIDIERQAASQFFRQVLRQKDMAFLISFGSDAELLQDTTGNVKQLERALGDLRVSGGSYSPINGGPVPTTPRGTILFDAVYLGVDEKLKTEAGRKALVLITDGMDQGSRYKLEQAVQASLRHDTLIYSIYYVDPMAYGFGTYVSDTALRKLSEETGGRLFHVDRKNPLDAIFRQIQDEMRSQYSISYSSTNPARDGAFRKLEIRARNRDLKVQARRGYFAPSS